MQAERWKQVGQIFGDAIERPENEREAFVRAACADDGELLDEILSLLAGHSEETTFLEKPPMVEEVWLGGEEAWAESLAGRRLGAYELERLLGKGGMGAVFLARRADLAYEQQVAIKLIRPGQDLGRSELLQRRFLAERQILARLEHPHIARLIDGGTSEQGMPYLVMEYVAGTPIDLYCDAHRLSLVERLHLLRRVCSAVHYAHQNLVVHRDLKPSNILVTAEGEPKLLDFGIAKLMRSNAQQQTQGITRMGHGPMTPDYASPEQVRGEPVNTGSDVYALGVVAYRLLCGYPPYQLDPRRPAELLRLVAEVEPPRPSQQLNGVGQGELPLWEVCQRRGERSPSRLSRRLQGDLDNIVLKALRKEARRRYRSAEELGQEIGRYLEGQPVAARRGGLGYRLAKLVLRHRIAAGAMLAALLLLLVSFAQTVRMAGVARQERQLAERRLGEIRSLATSFLFDIHDEVQQLPGSTRARQRLVTMALQYFERLSEESGDDARFAAELAAAYLRIGEVQAAPGRFGSLGDTAGALASYQQAETLYRGLLQQADSVAPDSVAPEGAAPDGAAPAQARVTEQGSELPRLQQPYWGLTEALLRQGEVHGLRGDREAAARCFQEALQRRQDLAQGGTHEAQLDLSVVHDRLGRHHYELGEHERALGSFRAAMQIRESVADQEPQNLQVQRQLSISLLEIGDVHFSDEQHEQALEHYRRALAMHQDLLSRQPTEVEAKRDLLANHERVAEVLQVQGEHTSALGHLEQAMAVVRELVGEDPLDASLRRDLGVLLNLAGDLLASNEQAQEALARYVEAMELRRELAQADPGNIRRQRDLAVSYYKMGVVHGTLGTEAAARAATRQGAVQFWREGRTWYERSLQLFEKLLQDGLLQRESDQQAPNQLRNAIADCDRALSELGSSS